MASTKKERDRAFASWMKDHPNQYPDSVRKPHDGCGSGERKLAMQMSAAGHRTGTWERGMFGGIIAARLGLGSENVPPEFIKNREAA